MNVLILDLEVENYEHLGSIASPRNPQNYVVAPGWAYGMGEVQHAYYSSKEESRDWLPSLDGVDCIVAHNAPFELEWMLHDHWDKLIQYFARGGRVFCTAYAEYLLSNQQSQYPSLDETAPKYGGTRKIDEVKLLWEQGYKTSQIDRDLLVEYLAGPGGDIENTRKVFFGQAQELVARGMWNMAFARMDGMLCNSFAMHAGLHVDRKRAWELKAQNEKALAAIDEAISNATSHIPPEVNFNINSDFHVSAWLFGGPIKYRQRDVWYNADGTPKYETEDAWQFADGSYIRVEEAASLDSIVAAQMVDQHGPLVRHASGKNKGERKVFKAPTCTPKLKWYDKVLNVAPVCDLSKLPEDVRQEWLKDFKGARKLCDGSPVYSSSREALEVLAMRKEYPDWVRDVLNLLLKRAKLDKDLGTYYLREKFDAEGNVIKTSGMLQYLGDDDIVHHTLNCTSTVTTRLSSNKPNFQNITRAEQLEDGSWTSEVKSIFTSRFGEDGFIIEADYSALEVVTLAALSKDPALMQALLNGTDMHCMRLAKMLGEPYEDVLRKCKDGDHPEHAKYKALRTAVKPRAFAYQYGATAMGIAYSTGCTVEDAQEFIDTEKALFPGVEAWFDFDVTPTVRKNTQSHQEQTAEGAWITYLTGTYKAKSGTCYEFREYPKVIFADGRRCTVMDFKPTQIRNYPIQGESAFFVQTVAGQIIRWLIGKNFFGGKCFVINQVHDAVYLDVHKDVLDEVARSVKYIMEALPETMKSYGYDLGLPFPAEVEYGPNMLEKHKWKEAA